MIQAAIDAVLNELQSEESRRVYKDGWTRYRKWLFNQDVAVLEARPRHIGGYIAHLRDEGNAKSTRSRVLSIIREIYGALVREELIASNPAREVKNPKTESAPSTPSLTADEVQSLLAAMPTEDWKDKRNRLCVCLLFGLGLRRAEVSRMCKEDFRTGAVTCIIKGNKRLTVGVPEWLENEVFRWCMFAGIEDGPILPRSRKNAKAISGGMVYKIVAQAGNEVGLKVSPHALRRTNITILGERGVSLKERQLAVGHASSSTTERYDRARDAAKNAPGQLLEDLVNGGTK